MLQIARNLIKHTHLFKISKMPPKITTDSNQNENVQKENKSKSQNQKEAPKLKNEKKGNPKILKQQTLKLVDKKGQIVDLTQKKLDLGDGIFSQDKLKISSWNINGLRASSKKESAVSYLNDKKFDIICLNELKVAQEAFEKENLITKLPKDYYAYLNFCKIKAGYSGVAILSKVKPISIKYDMGIEKHDQEGRIITAEFEKFNLVACYIPNSGDKLDRLNYRTQEWDVDFQNYLDQLKQTKNTIICGDLNVSHTEIDLANPEGNKRSAGFTQEERDSFSKFLSKGWIDTFRHLHPKEIKYSYFSPRFNSRETNKGWRIDYFLVNQEAIGSVIQSDISTTIIGSDHVPIECDIDLTKL
ncbi:unnamed protein product [Paramecium octaurelia]|uniref:DNA-(apurinic or apyrimidinic site) endonuclease n=1 Tax=Paramecium octaurelia TaxID=43137 RepID=A0A8S1WLG1_PAROT|nr:unnamed protein product [Paramecium octaurelia]